MYERFTDRAKKVMQVAQHEAHRLNHEAVATEHILLGLARDSSGVAANVLKKLVGDLRKVRAAAEKLVPAKPAKQSEEEKLPLSAGARQVVEGAHEEARELGHNHVGTEHLLLALLKVGDGAASRVLSTLSLKPEAVRDEVLRVLGHTPPVTESGSAKATPRGPAGSTALDTFAEDLTALARQKKLAPLIGRTAELDEVLQVASCLHRHRLLLVGEPGVGKRALLRGLATRIASGAVPEGLPSRVVRVDMALVVSGSPPTARLQTLLDEARAGGVILCVENLPLLFRLWDGTLGELFKSWLSGGAGPLIVPLTHEELKTLEGPQRELLTLFERLDVRPAALADALEVLRAVRERYEAHHRVKISDDALSTAVEQAEHLPGLKLPGSALRLLDRSAARVRLKTSAQAPGVQEMDAEFARLVREKDAAVAGQDFEKAADLRDQAEKLKARRDQAVREWEAVAGPVSEGVDARVVHEVLAHLGGRSG